MSIQYTIIAIIIATIIATIMATIMATTIEPIFDLAGLNDDVMGVVMCRIEDQEVFKAVCRVSKRFHNIFLQTLKIIAPQCSLRAEYYYSLFVNNYMPNIRQGLPALCRDLQNTCGARVSGCDALWYSVYAIYHIIYSRCDNCHTRLIIDKRNNLFFKLQIRDMSDDIINHLYGTVVGLCDACINKLENTHYIIHIRYAVVSPNKMPSVDYKIRRLTLDARVPMIVVNPDI